MEIHPLPLPPIQRKKKKEIEKQYNKKLPLLTNGTKANGGKFDNSFLFRSLLTPYAKGMPIVVSYIDENSQAVKEGKIEVSGVALAHLYRMAYFGSGGWTYRDSRYGKIASQIAFETRDSAFFIHDEKTMKGHYLYSLIVPQERSSVSSLKKIMQDDLQRYFGYNVSVEKRKNSAYQLITIDKNKTIKLKSHGSRPELPKQVNMYFRWVAKNASLTDFFPAFAMAIPYKRDSNNGGIPVIIDRTGINYLVDLDLKADFLNLESINSSLSNFGLRLEPTEVELETLVIKDKN